MFKTFFWDTLYINIYFFFSETLAFSASSESENEDSVPEPFRPFSRPSTSAQPRRKTVRAQRKLCPQCHQGFQRRSRTENCKVCKKTFHQRCVKFGTGGGDNFTCRHCSFSTNTDISSPEAPAPPSSRQPPPSLPPQSPPGHGSHYQSVMPTRPSPALELVMENGGFNVGQFLGFPGQ